MCTHNHAPHSTRRDEHGGDSDNDGVGDVVDVGWSCTITFTIIHHHHHHQNQTPSPSPPSSSFSTSSAPQQQLLSQIETTSITPIPPTAISPTTVVSPTIAPPTTVIPPTTTSPPTTVTLTTPEPTTAPPPSLSMSSTVAPVNDHATVDLTRSQLVVADGGQLQSIGPSTTLTLARAWLLFEVGNIVHYMSRLAANS
eukprot:m.87081 g.87081  ORF g.87081 m.87081 type:complete len:197 (-) comp26035_c0_seq2:608-1198(-)